MNPPPKPPSPFIQSQPVSELLRTAQIEVTREKIRDRPKREPKRFRKTLP